METDAKGTRRSEIAAADMYRDDDGNPNNLTVGFPKGRMVHRLGMITSNSDDAVPRGATVTKPLLMCLPQHVPLILTGNGRGTATRLTKTMN